jgi:dihydroneopterin aldolase
MSQDRIELRGLRVFARHGVLEAERQAGQEFIIDTVLWLDTRPAAADDEVSKTVDYGALADRLVHLAQEPPVRLIETLAERLAAACLSEPLVTEVEITVHKPQAPISHPFGDVAVVIRRGRPAPGPHGPARRAGGPRPPAPGPQPPAPGPQPPSPGPQPPSPGVGPSAPGPRRPE